LLSVGYETHRRGDGQRMAYKLKRGDSILQPNLEEPECYITGAKGLSLNLHHIYGGVANRPISDANGFWVYLCYPLHINCHADLSKDSLNVMLKQRCQRKYEETHTREEFIKLIGQNFLED